MRVRSSTRETEPGAPDRSRWISLLALRGRTPRARWVNVGLALVLGALLAAGVLVVGSPSPPQTVARTAVVTRGTVTSLVSSTGNTTESLTTEVNFADGGTLTAINVKEGDPVEAGQVLATVDPADKQNDLRTAEAERDGKRAAWEQARSGPTDVKKRQDQLAITQAEQSTTSAQTSLDNARAQLDLDEKKTATEVDNAEDTLAADRRTQNDLVEAAEDNLSACRSGSSTSAASTSSTSAGTTSAGTTSTDPASASRTSTIATTPASSRASTTAPTTTSRAPMTSPTATSRAPTTSRTAAAGWSATSPVRVRLVAFVMAAGDTGCSSERQSLTSARNTRTSTLQTDQQAVTTARQNRDSTLLSDRKAIDDAEASLISARSDVTAKKLDAEADLKPKTASEIAQARADYDGAEVTVAAAQLDVDRTQLKAPAAGVVLSINGDVGGTPGGAGSSGSSGSSGSDDGSSGESAFITLTNLSKLAVTSDIDEAAASKLRLGQPAQVTFTATGSTATGTVTRITPDSTVTNNVVRFPVTVSLDTAPPETKVGETAALAVTTGSAGGVLLAPSAAITRLPTGTTVTVRRGDTDTVVPVETGLVGDTDTEIRSGVREGDVLVLPAASSATTTSGPGGGG